MIVFGQHDEKTLDQLADVAARAERVALMADGHVGYIMPVGGVAAYRGRVSVAGVGFDIACGNCALRTDVLARELAPQARERLADTIQRTISFGIGRTNRSDDAPVDHPLFDDEAWTAVPASVSERERLRRLSREQLGTVGSGNHYVDLLADEEGFVWAGVHFGSRGLGHTIASGFMSVASGKPWGERVPEIEALLELDSELGARYWRLMELAGRYAYAGREWVTRKVAEEIVGGGVTELVHNHHNFAWKEKHLGEELVVVRKGATPAFPGQSGFVGGSMGDLSVILRGVDERARGARGASSSAALDAARSVVPDAAGSTTLAATSSEALDAPAADRQRRALFSTVHGAGRVMSRTEAAGKRHRVGRKAGQLVLDGAGRPVREGKVSERMMHDAVRAAGVVLRGGGPDESPQVYRRLERVLAEQPGVEIVHRLTPIVVVMAGAGELDPYKD